MTAATTVNLHPAIMSSAININSPFKALNSTLIFSNVRNTTDDALTNILILANNKLMVSDNTISNITGLLATTAVPRGLNLEVIGPQVRTDDHGPQKEFVVRDC